MTKYDATNALNAGTLYRPVNNKPLLPAFPTIVPLHIYTLHLHHLTSVRINVTEVRTTYATVYTTTNNVPVLSLL
jgi:hypothetical protein